MKFLPKLILVLALLTAVGYIAIRVTHSEYLIKGFWASYLHGHNSATISDAAFFDTHTIASGNQEEAWPQLSNFNKIPLSDSLKNVLKETRTVAFLVVQNDSLLLEEYWEKYSDSSRSNSFSMAKSIVTMLSQIAIQKGILSGWNQKVQSILPDVKGEHAAELEIWHLSTMTSGLEWDEKYKDPFAVTAKAYYGKDVKSLMMTLPIVGTPGKVYNYQSGSTQLLGLCLTEKTGKTLAELASEWLWKPMHASHDATWHTDDVGTELAYCCFNSNARDFARFGKLMLHQGNWNGTQVLDSAFVHLATQPALAPYYGYSFWLDDSHGTEVFYQRGILGQYIITIPARNLVIVRLGHERIEPGDAFHSPDFHVIVSQVLKMTKEI